MIKITLDTNQLDDEKVTVIHSYAKKLGFDVKTVTVTDREIEGSSIKSLKNPVLETGVWDESQWDNFVWGGDSVNEAFVLGESKLGSANLGSAESASLFELLLKTISNGSFPKLGKRDNLSAGERRLMRDVMIIEAHIREKRDIFVSDDKKAFIGKTGQARKTLEELGKTKIMTHDEFISYCKILENKQ
ncbi:MAG TPA: hypothetical protein VE090_03385 [Methylomirabilota bacterium]|nr:hypothetical protein [Methylomirabilota bacterium]